MSIKMLRSIAPAIIAFAALSSNATAGNVVYTGSLKSLGTDWYGVGYVFSMNAVTSLCSTGEFFLSSSAPGYKEQVATLLVAWGQGQNVTVTTDASNSCPNNRANIVGVLVPSR